MSHVLDSVEDAIEEEKVNLKYVCRALMATTGEVTGWSVGDLSMGLVYLKKHNTKAHKENLSKDELHFDPKTAVKDKELIKTLQHTWELADGTYQKDDRALIRRTMIRKENLLVANWKSEPFTPAYFIALDHITKSVVFGVRGTASTMDVLTDLAAKPVPFLSGFAHEGISSGSNLVWKKMKPLLLKTVQEHKGKFPNLMFCGHSLGAGVSSLLTMLAKEDPDFAFVKNIRCYAFAPPCVVSLDLAQKYADIVTSVVNEFDAVPRMTLSAVNALRAEVAEFEWKNAAMDHAARTRLGKGAGNLKSKIAASNAYRKTAAVTMKAKSAIASSGVGKKIGSLFGKKDKDKEPEKDEPVVEATTQAAEEAVAAAEEEAKEAIGLFPPGRCYHLCFDNQERYYLVPRDNDYFCSLELKAGMFKHHLLDQYAIGLRSHLKYLD